MDVYHIVFQTCEISGFTSLREENQSLTLEDGPEKLFRNFGKKLTVLNI